MSRILYDQSNAEYHSEGGYSSTYIKNWALRSPAHAEYAEKTINPYTADEGTAAHLVFEGKPELVFEAGEIRRGTVWEEAKKQAIAVGGVALPKKAYKNAMGAGQSARLHPFMYDNGYHGKYPNWVEYSQEPSIFTQHPATGLTIKCKPDLYFTETGTLVDLKTTVSAAPNDFTRSIFKYGYDLQAAFYRIVCREAGLLVGDEFHFIAVEKTPPYAAQHFALEADILSVAELRVEQILLEIAQSRKTGVYSTGWPSVSKINLSTREYAYVA